MKLPIAAEAIRTGDQCVVVDGRIRIADRKEAQRRMLAEFKLWSGGFSPAETTPEERQTFLAGRELDEAQYRIMWSDQRPPLGKGESV